MEVANLPTFLKFENAKKSDIFIFAKIMGSNETGGGWSRTGGLCPLGSGLKPPLPLRPLRQMCDVPGKSWRLQGLSS